MIQESHHKKWGILEEQPSSKMQEDSQCNQTELGILDLVLKYSKALESPCQTNTVLAKKENIKLSHQHIEIGKNYNI